MERSTLDLWVGLFVCAGIGALLILALKVGNMASLSIGSDSYTLYANFDNIGGLKPRAPVKSAGVVVGRVASIAVRQQPLHRERRDEHRQPLQVSQGHDRLDPHFRACSASSTSGLDAGGDQANLASGDTMKLTQSAIVLEKLISQFLYSKAAEGDTGKK